MVRTSGLTAEILNYLIDNVLRFELGARARRHTMSTFAIGRRDGGTRGDQPFTHAVHELAVLSLSARSVLALRS
jgi:hypothetical protein